MRISRRTSGGRGEYELSGSLPSGARTSNLIGYLISLEFPEGLVIHARVRIVRQGGKPRLRMDGADIQIQKQLAAAFMMPDPARQNATLGAGEPVMQDGAYAVEHIEVDSLIRVKPDIAVMRVSRITLLNRSHLGEEENLSQRAVLLQEVWRRRGEFPSEISTLLERHETAVRGGTVTEETQSAVAQIQRIVSERSADLGIVYSERGDVLPKLGEALHYQVPQPLIDVERVDPEDIELKKRAVKEWKRWANARGPASAKFRQQVRDAYQATCIICGAHFPKTPYPSAPGVDAAHILPWSLYELDEVYNGLCLCKLHHWAFDEGIIFIRHDRGRYISEMPREAEQKIKGFDPEFSLDKLEEDLGVIPAGRLPADRQQWPRPQLLEMLAGMT
ncbi:MAG: HNH endonuclease [Pyrinomonadaceae bacterium]